ncbi:phosphotransferase [Chitinibacteraceae bacterium HSL-7]
MEQAFCHAAQAWYNDHYGEPGEVERDIAGFYGHVVLINGAAAKVAVKFAFQAGRAEREVIGLERLRAHVALPMPDVIALTAREVGGVVYPVLALTRVPGAAPWHAQFASTPDTARALVDTLLGLHAVSDERGYEWPGGFYSQSLLPALEAWWQPLFEHVASPESPYTAPVRAALLGLWAERASVVAPINLDASSLVHDDPHAGNVLFDVDSGLPTALLDPCDVAFRHREQDIFHLHDCMPELGLLDAYLARYTPPEGFEVRRWFFSLLDDVKHCHNRGWYDDEWFLNKLAAYSDARNKAESWSLQPAN